MDRARARARFGRQGLLAVLASSVCIAAEACSVDRDQALLTEGYRSSTPGDTHQFFALDHLVEVAVEIAPEDWDSLRREGRDIVGVFTRSQPNYEYTYFDADVTIDGERYEHVALRKKGFWGSLSVVRPSLKIHFARNAPGRRHLGLKRLTLNNDRVEPSHTHQCMAYRLFARAGLHAPRCNLAHVVVNGQDLGTYSHVESLDEDMLERVFGDGNGDGNLYEGQLTDVVSSDIDFIELGNNQEQNDKSDLRALAAALEAPDAEVVERLSAVLDLDRFRDFWAMEMLTEHWDGYSNNMNNYALYHDPLSNRFVFIPWGTDGAFDGANPMGRVFANGRIAYRLYHLLPERDRFLARLAEFNDTLWNPATLLGEIDQIAAVATDASPQALEHRRGHVQQRAERLRAALRAAPPRWRNRRSPCRGQVGPVSGSFETVWGSLGSIGPDTGAFQANVTLDGQEFSGASWIGGAGIDSRMDGSPRIRFIGSLPAGVRIEFDLFLEPTTYDVGSRPFHGGETSGSLSVRVGSGVRPVGSFGAGTIELREAGRVDGERVAGAFSGQLVQLNCASLPKMR